MIIVISKNNCQPCKMVKKLLTEKNVSFIEHNIDKEPEWKDVAVSLGFQRVPLTLNVVPGFAPTELKKLIEV